MASQNPNGTKREEKGRNIQVVVRCRPFNTADRKSSYGVIDCDTNRRELIVKTGGVNDKASRKTYTFDMVFGPAAKQIDVYRSVVCPILDEVIMGYNCTVFAYGQTGTGKTFTMEGERSPNEQFTWDEDPLAGIIPRTLHQIFEKLSKNGTEFSVKVSLLEIYNEELFDLLSPSDDVSERLQLFDDPRNKVLPCDSSGVFSWQRSVVVKGLEEVTVHNKDEVYQILERGAAKRKTASTLMNAYSSRSHSVFSVTIHMKEITLEGEELVKIGKLNLVDLAGSENIGRSGAVDKRAREAGNINQSLLTLGRVITALVEKRPHIPYRESKLTRILQDSLGGRTKTSIIATVSPSSSNLEETLSTLEYASRAKNIMNKPEVNQKLTKRTLIKEYTEEIERLKRDLAATRDKNGVYLSTENYETMISQITSHEEHVAELTDRIALMEEELRRVMELFTDNKTQLDQCSLDLTEKQQRLEETKQNLEQTKEKLCQEEFICSELESAQEHLYITAGQLLSAADTSTTDVSRLHDKLDRKKKVEQHNSYVQHSFIQRMAGAFSSMQHCIQQQEAQHRSNLSNYSKAVDGLLVTNEAALQGAMSTVESFVGGVGRLLAQNVSQCKEKIEHQQLLCLQDKERIVQMLDEHWQDMEEVLVEGTLMGLSAIQDLSTSLRAIAQTQRVLAQKVEAMNATGVLLGSLVHNLARLREESVLGLKSLQAEHDRLEEEIRNTQERHQMGMKRTIQSLQDQLNLLTTEVQTDFFNLQSVSTSMQKPFQSLQENISNGCILVENQMSAQAALLSSTTSSLASSLHLATDESLQNLEKLTGRCSHLHNSVSGLVEQGLQWSSRSREQVAAQVQGQLSFMEIQSSDTQTLQQNMEMFCKDQVRAVGREMSGHQVVVKHAVAAVQDHLSQDQSLMDQQRNELLLQVQLNQQLVQDFLMEELQQDVPTGTTPQRRELVYPRELIKLQSRYELLETLRKQQEALHSALQEDEDMQDTLEDELSTCNESLATEPSFVDENLVFNESKRLPFFKKGGKESKIPAKSKVTETEAGGTPQKSRLPLRCQN
ncbi:kinesin-like protein KIF11 isoform X1 [Takifugu flavidus]|uniref:kinesin-like protein KIF11 isoform X1 n=1 Tax=Takifugu flavidus TaxID=433684 RepID=UPI002544AE70|nr:kinesin-like protein KIF11 isoform X1 [Takifugu flavidus]XP_056903642.1 kinesin-like protein KIF11 isoform X1 [Takifugu flavidus]XP_056903644.1 kinesin-like protein KIF11 isoform X1 [Takifugu flavidus]